MDTHSLLETVVQCSFGITALAMIAAFVYFLGMQRDVSRRLRRVILIGALVAVVAAVAYGWMLFVFETALDVAISEEGAASASPSYAFYPILQIRYMVWFIAMPLLLMQLVWIVPQRRRPKKLPAFLVASALWMLTAAFIGEQFWQIQVRHLVWGVVATLGYALTVFLVFTNLRRNAVLGEDELLKNPIPMMCILLITTWGIYPIGYIATALFPEPRVLLSVHLAYNLADLVNLLAPGHILISSIGDVFERPRLLSAPRPSPSKHEIL